MFISNVSQRNDSENCLKGLIFVVSGYFYNFPQKEIEKIITHYGGLVCSELSSKTNYIVVGLGADANLIKRALWYQAIFLPKIKFFAVLLNIINGLREDTRRSVFLRGDGFPEVNSPLYSKAKSDTIAGKNFVLTGLFDILPRFRFTNLIWFHKGKCNSTLSSETSFLLTGKKSCQTKIAKAASLNVMTITQEEFLRLLLNSAEYNDLLRLREKNKKLYDFQEKYAPQYRSLLDIAADEAIKFSSYDLLVNVDLPLIDVKDVF